MIGYSIPAEPISVEIEIKRSRFICHVSHADTAESAKGYIAEINLQYLDATHNCWAFQAEAPGSTRSIGCSDDGEPHGTAGKPMLNVLSHLEIGEIVAVVTRYYGGTKLGTGGLVRAYSDSVKAAVAQLKLCEKVEWHYAKLKLEYAWQSMIEKILSDHGAEIISSKFDEKITIDIRYDGQTLNELNIQLSNVSQGKLVIVPF